MNHLHDLEVQCAGGNEYGPSTEWQHLDAFAENLQDGAYGYRHPTIRLADLPNLEKIDLEEVQFDARGMSDLRRLDKLQQLWIHADAPDEPPSLEVSNFPHLRNLLIENHDGSEITVGDLPQLEWANLVLYSQTAKVRLHRLPRLRIVELESKLTPTTLELLEVGELQQLVLSQPYKPPPAPGTIRATNAPPPAPTVIGGLPSLHKLKRLDLPGRSVDAALAADIGGLATLESLDLQGSGLTDERLAQLRKLGNLRELDLSDTDVSAAGLNALANMPRLARLKLQNARIPDADPFLARLKASHPGLGVDRGSGTN